MLTSNQEHRQVLERIPKAVGLALALPPIAAIALRNADVISFLTSEWITSIWILGYIVVLGWYYAKAEIP